LPSWWGAGVCRDPITGETFIGGADGVPVPAWPPGVPLPSASEMAKQKVHEQKKATPKKATPKKKPNVVAQRKSPRLLNKRMPSERIVKRKLAMTVEGPGESKTNAMDLE